MARRSADALADNSDELKYYGSGFTNSEKIQTEKIEYHGCQSSFAIEFTGPMGLQYAKIEVYQNGNWHGVDPTNNRLADENYIIISRGRDFADCGINRGLLTGGGMQTQTVGLKVTKR